MGLFLGINIEASMPLLPEVEACVSILVSKIIDATALSNVSSLGSRSCAAPYVNTMSTTSLLLHMWRRRRRISGW
jgi:hypothetical protein